MSYDSIYDHYEVKGGCVQHPTYYDRFDNALNDYLNRIKFTKNGFDSEIILSAWDVNLNGFVVIQWVIVP